ncbi:LytTR family DNA-binding domain-containing protein [Lentilactobacillus hilgardii]|uniref:LytTr DNA-binding domain protein n=1 Tax=Lentilactobacillus hilgardii (strain ATCC 8290 / DSM 20176 / CCUG 30140 / JCM 1155 / KCTC 3500 / NBRC 15886 / NCIMB 8040 / NRRL B-1843 / 9) TaxID=1423757 RepID=C0XKB3_LENH9|nr:LytTR family DNA-binding domain-containing protein [Lentilactobacillus hilgardii]EEI24191.1 LytTr DNA-binding domain protein [Lentilactobacillus hilgardii DSM 20176 = ATCC 8290]KRK53730.1 hypothetical protein FD42_GL001655 [Lentilactobacillus hilgardii DSM 20176 = ATCC 8290]TDG83848.1 hypothetical protein C5L34_000340 [Lentilactobacillus hilgardii]
MITIKIIIKKLSQKETTEDLAIFKVHNISGTVQQAIDILKSGNKHLLAKLEDHSREEQISYQDIVYAEYLERQMILYTNSKIYYIRQSLNQFNQDSPDYLLQISKNILVNLYAIKAFEARLNGTLVVQLTTDEKQIVSRHFVPILRKRIHELAQNT